MADPPKTTENQSFQQSGSPGSPGSAGGVVKINATHENTTRIKEKLERINSTSPTSLTDPGDPIFETPSGTSFNPDHPLLEGVTDPGDPGDSADPIGNEEVEAAIAHDQQPTPVPAPATDSDGWLSEDCLGDMAANLEACPDSETLADLRQCWPRHALSPACDRLKPESRERINRWVIQQNADSSCEDASPNQNQQTPATTDFEVGARVFHADEYTPMSLYHGTVEAIFSDEVLVRWDEWSGRCKQSDRYCPFDLKRLD